MNSIVRISLAAMVLTAVTAAPASAAQVPVTDRAAGLCRILPKWCPSIGAELVLDSPIR